MAEAKHRARMWATRASERKAGAPAAAVAGPARAAERSPAEALGGNQAVQRLARGGVVPPTALAALGRRMGNQAIQRLVYVPGKIVTTNGWLDKVKAEAVKQDDAYDEQILKVALAEFVDSGVQKIVPKFKGDRAIYDAYKTLEFYKKGVFEKDVADEANVNFYNHTLATKDDGKTKKLVDPSVVWTGRNDLGAEVNPWYACVLISLLKVIGYDKIREKYSDLAAKNGEADQVREMHRVFFSVKGKHYDDWSGNVPLYQQFGLRFRPIKSTWGKVHQQIPMPNGTYIFAFDTHMMALKVTTDLREKQQQDADADWYQPFASVFQPGYSLTFAQNRNKRIDYLFYKP
jgi:hypothetical protein